MSICQVEYLIKKFKILQKAVYVDMMKESREEGREEGQRIMLVAMVKDGEIKIESAARRLGITPEEFKKLL